MERMQIAVAVSARGAFEGPDLFDEDDLFRELKEFLRERAVGEREIEEQVSRLTYFGQKAGRPGAIWNWGVLAGEKKEAGKAADRGVPSGGRKGSAGDGQRAGQRPEMARFV